MLTDFCGKISVGLLLLASLWAPGCASSRSKADRDEMAAMRGQLNEMRNGFRRLTTRMETVEGKINTLSATVAPADHVSSTNANASPVEPHPGEGSGVSPTDVPSARDPDGAFVNDDAVQDFRKAMIRFRAGQYPEAEMPFSRFLEKYPDHPLAGNAGLSRRAVATSASEIQAGDRGVRSRPHDLRSQQPRRRDLARPRGRGRRAEADRQAARHRQLLSLALPAFSGIAGSSATKCRLPKRRPPRRSAHVTASGTKFDGPPPTAPGPSTAADSRLLRPRRSAPSPAEHAVIQMQDVAPDPPATAAAGELRPRPRP